MKREPKKSDQDNTQKAFELLIDLIILHQKEIEPALWMGAMVAALADNFAKSDISFKEFKKEISGCIKHYRY